MTSRTLAAALLSLVLVANATGSVAEPAALSDACRPFAVEAGVEHPLLRLCARLVEAQRAGNLTTDQTDAARRLGDYLTVLARLELRLVPEAGGYRLQFARRTSETARYLIADHLGLIAIAERLAPAA